MNVNAFKDMLKTNIYFSSSHLHDSSHDGDRRIMCELLFDILCGHSNVVYDRFVSSHPYFEPYLFSQDLSQFGLEKYAHNTRDTHLIFQLRLVVDLNIFFVRDNVHFVILNEPFNDFYKGKLSDQYSDSGIVFMIAPRLLKKHIIQAIDLFGHFERTDLSEDIVNSIVSYAFVLGSSDIHLHLKHHADLLLRIDGVLLRCLSFHGELFSKLSQRLKLLCKLDINNTRLPQDGHFRLRNGFKSDYVDVRVSFYPSFGGESIVLRVPSSSNLNSLESLIIDEDHLMMIRKNLLFKSGLILVSGPTGSGKSTLLYSILRFLSNQHKKIISIEDPVEQEIDGIVQSQVNEDIGFDFFHALKFILRQDPDIIMLGEIRDEKTLAIALRASISGHLVLSSVHSYDCLSSIDRLKDLGARDFLIRSALRLVLSVRLLKRLCVYCKKYHDSKYVSSGCSECHNSGYSGRIMISEALEIHSDNHDILFDKRLMNRYLADHGFRSLGEVAYRLYKSGEIDYEESVV